MLNDFEIFWFYLVCWNHYTSKIQRVSVHYFLKKNIRSIIMYEVNDSAFSQIKIIFYKEVIASSPDWPFELLTIIFVWLGPSSPFPGKKRARRWRAPGIAGHDNSSIAALHVSESRNNISLSSFATLLYATVGDLDYLTASSLVQLHWDTRLKWPSLTISA